MAKAMSEELKPDREECQIRLGHKIHSRYYDDDGTSTHTLLTLDDAPEGLFKEQKLSVSRNESHFRKAVAKAEKEGGVTWKYAGTFHSLALALAAAKVRMLVMQHSGEDRARVVKSTMDLVDFFQEEAEGQDRTASEALLQSNPTKKKTSKKKG